MILIQYANSHPVDQAAGVEGVKMDRTVPSTGTEEIELYIRTYYSLLRATTEVSIRSLEEVHAGMGSALHPDARSPKLDTSAFIYSGLRLPSCVISVESVILGQAHELFIKAGIALNNWQRVNAKARRRMNYFDGDRRLASFVGSASDIDDIIPLLTAFQIEWNKLHDMMLGTQVRKFLSQPLATDDDLAALAHGIGVEMADLLRLRSVWGDRLADLLRAIADRKKRFKVRLLSGSYNDYRKATQRWWKRAEKAFPDIGNRPVYFVSSNPHSIVNLLSGFALKHADQIVDFLQKPEHRDLLLEWKEIESKQVPSSRENFLYYTLKKFIGANAESDWPERKQLRELESGIQRISSKYSFDVDVQLIELAKLNPAWIDPRLRGQKFAGLRESNALIVNIDYPLGFSAYLILSYLASRVGEIRGVYLLGKAATLNGVIGDVMIPSVIHDEHSKNTYLFNNVFSAEDVAEHLVYGTVLDNQKAVSVRGTFLQTPSYMGVFYSEGYADIEMESGPYLSAVCELFRPRRYPENEIINLHNLPFDLGILHYASDTPLSKGKNLGAGSLSYFGMDPTYASSVAILRRIFYIESGQYR